MSVKLEKLDNVKFLLNYRNQNNTYLKVITSCLCSFSLLSTLLRLLLSAVIVQWKHHVMRTIQHSSPALLPVVRVAWNQLWGEFRHHRDSTLYEHLQSCFPLKEPKSSSSDERAHQTRSHCTISNLSLFLYLDSVYPGSAPLLDAQLLSSIFKVFLPQIGTVLTLTSTMSLMALCKFLGWNQYTLDAQ